MAAAQWFSTCRRSSRNNRRLPDRNDVGVILRSQRFIMKLRMGALLGILFSAVLSGVIVPAQAGVITLSAAECQPFNPSYATGARLAPSEFGVQNLATFVQPVAC